MASEQNPARDNEILKLQNLFLEFDQEKKGWILPQHLFTVLQKSGYMFEEKLVSNIEAVLDRDGEERIYFQQFVWMWDMLNLLITQFSQRAPNGRMPTSELPAILYLNEYKNFAPSTLQLLALIADPSSSGSFTFPDLISTILFIRFSLNTFSSADQEKKGFLTFDQIQSLLPVLGIEVTSMQEAQDLFNAHDLDRNGTIDPYEFIDITLGLKFPHLARYQVN